MKYRAEIDGLRALAVLPVIFFHADFKFAHRGFLGVDIFFVISGFLSTSIILSDLEQGRFSFAKFYDRRIRRIMPALLCVFLVSLVLAKFTMLPTELIDFGKSLMASMVFCANFFFSILLGDYFSPNAYLQPLLHIWSLAVEEQFYIVFPVLLLVLARFTRRIGIIVVFILTIASLALCMTWGKDQQIWNFYMMPTRFWELAAGALLAMSALDKRALSLFNLNILSALGLALILYSYAFIPINGVFPGFTTIPIILGTVLLLGFARTETYVARFLSLKALVAIGLISYSAYLWHQPLFVFARLYFFEGEVSKVLYIILIILTFVLSGLSWYFIERPFRKKGHKGLVFGSLGILSMVVMLAGVSLVFFPKSTKQLEELTEKTKYSVGLSHDCEGRFDARCISGENPQVLVWGDSFAIHIVKALESSKTKVAFAQYTQSGCIPVFGFGLIMKQWGIDWTKDCMAFNENLKNIVKQMPSLKYVIIASEYDCIEEEHCDIYRNGKVVRVKREQWLQDMEATLTWLRDAGLEPVIIGPTPSINVKYSRGGACYIRAMDRYGTGEKCDLDRQEVDRFFKPRISYLKALEKVAPVVYLVDYLCDDNKCPSSLNGEPLYVDSLGHLTTVGGIELGKKTDLFKHILDAADSFYKAQPLQQPQP